MRYKHPWIYVISLDSVFSSLVELAKYHLFSIDFSHHIFLICLLIAFSFVHKNVKRKRKESNTLSTIYSSFVIDEDLPRPDPPSLDNHLTCESSVRLHLSYFFQDQFIFREYKYRLKERNKDYEKVMYCFLSWLLDEIHVKVLFFAQLIYTCWSEIWSLRLWGQNFHKLLLVTKMSYECFAFFAQSIGNADDIYSSVSGNNFCHTSRFSFSG